MAVGVPEISPVVESRTNPAGKSGDTANDAISPPVLVNVTGVIAVPTPATNDVVLEVIFGREHVATTVPFAKGKLETL